MLLAFVVWGTIAVCIANPLHKYPYVFLLDVGNEELQKTNTEQLRVSIPGGSLAMKYPAMGEGDPISHVRVSGIDFGTDLKVNIAEGGPGYKYVVLMFMGNPGVTYDTVVTLQTLTGPEGTEMNLVSANKIATTENLLENSYEISDADSDENDQDSVNDLKNMKQSNKKSKEVMQSTSTFYNYAKSEEGNSDEDKETENISAEEQDVNDDDDDEDSVEEKDEDENEFSKNGDRQLSIGDKLESSYQDESKVSEEHEGENEEAESVKSKLYSGQDFDQFSDIPRAEQYRYNPNLNNEDNAKPDSTHEKYQEIPHFGLGFRVYPQSFIYNKQYQGNSAYNNDDRTRFAQRLNNEEVANDPRFRDNSNNIDSDYLVAEY